MLILAGGASTGLAQERQIGLKGGVNVASVSFDGDSADGYNERRVGFVGGGFAVLPLTSSIAVQVEGLFSQKGAQFSEDAENLEATLELDYLEVPVMLRIAGPTIGNNRLHFFGGPSAAFRMGARSKLSVSTSSFAQGSIDNIEDDIEPFDFGIVAAPGSIWGAMSSSMRVIRGVSALSARTSLMASSSRTACSPSWQGCGFSASRENRELPTSNYQIASGIDLLVRTRSNLGGRG